MLNINEKYYIEINSNVSQPLFDENKAANGFYKIVGREVKLYDLNKALFAFVVNNKFKEIFFVSAFTYTDGSDYFMYALSNSAEQYLGVENMRIFQERDCAVSVINQLGL